MTPGNPILILWIDDQAFPLTLIHLLVAALAVAGSVVVLYYLFRRLLRVLFAKGSRQESVNKEKDFFGAREENLTKRIGS